MKFNFPDVKREKFVSMPFSWGLYSKYKAIADSKELPFTDVIRTVLAEALEEYETTFGVVTPIPDETNTADRTKESLQISNKRNNELKKQEELPESNILPSKEVKNIPEKLPKDWYKKDVIKIQLSEEEKKEKKKAYQREYMRKYNAKHKQIVSQTLPDINIEIKPELKPNLEAPVESTPVEIANCQYLLCGKYKHEYIRVEGIEAGGKNFCSERCYESFLESIKDNPDKEVPFGSFLTGSFGGQKRSRGGSQ